MNKVELDKIINGKSQDINVPDYSIEDIRKFMKIGKKERTKEKTLKISVITIFLVVILGAFTVIYNLNTNNIKGIDIEANTGKKQEERICVDTIVNGNVCMSDDSKVDNIYIITVDEIVSESLINDNPLVKIKATVNKTLKGNTADTITFSMNQTMISINDYEKITGEKIGKYSQYSKEEKESLFLRVIVEEGLENTPYPEVNKKYIVSLIKDSNGKNIVVVYSKYRFYEVNEKEDKVNIKNEWNEIFIEN